MLFVNTFYILCKNKTLTLTSTSILHNYKMQMRSIIRETHTIGRQACPLSLSSCPLYSLACSLIHKITIIHLSTNTSNPVQKLYVNTFHILCKNKTLTLTSASILPNYKMQTRSIIRETHSIGRQVCPLSLSLCPLYSLACSQPFSVSFLTLKPLHFLSSL